MPNFEFVKKIFKVGMTRTQFIQEYAKQVDYVKQMNDGSESIFWGDDNLEVFAGGLFDLINVKKAKNGEEETLDAEEIANVANFDKSDGEGNLTELDVNVLMKKYQESFNSNLEIDSPEKMYQKAVSQASQSPDGSMNSYFQTLTLQISAIESLAYSRQMNSYVTITNYHNEINTLVQNDSSVSSDLKQEYNKANNRFNSLTRQELSLGAKIKEKESKVSLADSEYKNVQLNISAAKSRGDEDVDYSEDLSNAADNLNQLNTDLDSLKSQHAGVTEELKKAKNNLVSLQSRITEQSSGLKTKIEAINKKIEEERMACQRDVQEYSANIVSLQQAQMYAIQQTQSSAAANENGYTDNGADTYIYDESNYDEAAVAAVEQRWAAKASKNGLDHKFFVKVTAIAKELKCDPNALLAIMNSESGLNSKARNPNGGATGLIQFMPSTARGLGTTTEALRNMSAYDQLDYVAKFLLGAKKRCKMGDTPMSPADVYSMIFLPARANREILTSKGEIYYNANAATDIDGDGNISKSDLNKRIQKFMA